MSDQAYQMTPEARRESEKRARKERFRFKLRLLYASTIYRPVMKTIHKLNWCWMEAAPVEPGRYWCQWCGMRGRKPVWEPGKKIV